MNIENINITELHLFRENPFKVRQDEAFKNLIESISSDGIYEPLIVCPDKEDNGYIIVSGQRRFEAAKAAGLETVPAVIHNMDRDKMIIAIVDNNICSRDILPSEKAFGYKLKYEAMKRTAGRPSNNSCQVGTNFRTDKEMAENSEDSARQIQRYIRLTNLIPELLKLIDDRKIAFSVGVELSYLNEEKQYEVIGLIEEFDCTPSYAQANKMHKDFAAGVLTYGALSGMMSAEKPNQIPTYKIPQKSFERFLARFNSNDERTVYLIKACECYEKELRRKRDKGVR